MAPPPPIHFSNLILFQFQITEQVYLTNLSHPPAKTLAHKLHKEICNFW